MISLAKKIDKATFYILGDIFRKITNINSKKYWDKYFSKYESFYRDLPYRFLLDINVFPKNTTFSLLDIGCAMGDGCKLIKANFSEAKINGADLSSVAIEKARKNSAGINFYILDLKKDLLPQKYDFIVLSHILEHFNDPFPIVDKCLKFTNKALVIITPYIEKFDNPRLYAKSEHRYLFNEHTFLQYKCTILKITDYIENLGYKYIIYKMEP